MFFYVRTNIFERCIVLSLVSNSMDECERLLVDSLVCTHLVNINAKHKKERGKHKPGPQGLTGPSS
jgi:hypothetical protein